MKDNLKIAWRNLWRNSRRTLITASSIFFGVFFVAFMSSLQKGSFENMVDNMVRFYTGYIQVQQADFKELKSINNSFETDTLWLEKLKKHEKISQTTQRVESFALAGSESNSFPAMLLGIIPENEDRISGLSKWLSDGEFLSSGSKDILIGKTMAENLNVTVDDSLVLIGQGYHGVSAAGIYRVAGLLDFPLPDLSKQVMYMDIDNCRDFLSIPNRLTSLVIMVPTPDDVEKTVKLLKTDLPADLNVLTWDELMPELLSLIEGKVASGKVVKALLFMVIGFGVWATIIMLMNERKRELGVMIAIGFQKIRVIVMIVIESFFIGLIGVLCGAAASYPLLWYLAENPIVVTGKMAETYKSMGFEPIIKFNAAPEVFYTPAVIVFAIFALISVYQVYYVIRLKTVEALRA